MVFEKRVLHFHFALGPAIYVAGPVAKQSLILLDLTCKMGPAHPPCEIDIRITGNICTQNKPGPQMI